MAVDLAEPRYSLTQEQYMVGAFNQVISSAYVGNSRSLESCHGSGGRYDSIADNVVAPSSSSMHPKKPELIWQVAVWFCRTVWCQRRLFANVKSAQRWL